MPGLTPRHPRRLLNTVYDYKNNALNLNINVFQHARNKMLTEPAVTLILPGFYFIIRYNRCKSVFLLINCFFFVIFWFMNNKLAFTDVFVYHSFLGLFMYSPEKLC